MFNWCIHYNGQGEGLLPVAVRQIQTKGAGPGHVFNVFVDVWPVHPFSGQ